MRTTPMEIVSKMPENLGENQIARRVVGVKDGKPYNAGYGIFTVTPPNPLHKKFQVIASLRNDILKASPAPKNDPDYPVDALAFAEEIEALVQLCGDISHSDAYYAFLDNTRDITLNRLTADPYFLQALRDWDKTPFARQREILRQIHETQTQAAAKVSGLDLKMSPMRYYSTARKAYPEMERSFLTRGYFATTPHKQSIRRSIHLNTHEDAGFQIPTVAPSITYHETVHDHQFQIGQMWGKAGAHRLGALREDAEICHLKAYFRAVISGRIFKAYEAQFHEVAARREQVFFQDGLVKALFPDLGVAAP